MDFANALLIKLTGEETDVASIEDVVDQLLMWVIRYIPYVVDLRLSSLVITKESNRSSAGRAKWPALSYRKQIWSLAI